MATKTIQNVNGTTFHLTANRIEERLLNNEVYRFVQRGDVHAALRGIVGKNITLHHPGDARDNYPIFAFKDSSATSVYIGCQFFNGNNAVEIIKWARSYRKPATKKTKTVAKTRAAAAGKAKRKKQ